MYAYDIEYTDTFGGDANYCWVDRAIVHLPEPTTQRKLMKAAKAAMGLTGMRGKVSNYGDTIEFRPYRMATIMFVTWRL